MTCHWLRRQSAAFLGVQQIAGSCLAAPVGVKLFRAPTASGNRNHFPGQSARFGHFVVLVFCRADVSDRNEFVRSSEKIIQ